MGTSNRMISVKKLLSLMDELVAATENAISTKALYPKDITKATKTMDIYSTITRSVEGLDERRYDVANAFVQSISLVTSHQSYEYWRNFADSVSNKNKKFSKC